jgi:colicin import membrane protein
MAEQKESSVLFSLKELMNLEEDRIKQEEADKDRRARHEAESKAAAERAARDAEERRIRDEEESRRIEEQRRKEEATRLDAIRHGEIEKAKAEAEHKSRMEALTQQQAHEQQLAALNSDKGKKRLKMIVGVAVSVLLIAVVGGGVAFKNAAEQREKERAADQARIATAEAESKRLKNTFDEAQKREEELRHSLDSAKDEATRAKLEAELSKATEQKKQAGAAMRSTASGASKPAGAAKPCNCPPGDPLCSCL